MNISDKGINLIKSFEGFSLKSYLCSAGVWTIGYGHTKSVYKGMTITKEQAEKYFYEDIKPVEKMLNSKNLDLNQNQYDALVSFVFNLGEPKFLSSTLYKCLKNKQFKTAGEQFSKWVYANGKISKGLINRRAKEKELFLS